MTKIAAYKEMINNSIEWALKSNNKTVKIYPVSKVGSGKYSQYGTDHTKDYTSYLDSLKVKYTIGNDSPRGGQLGKFIEIKIDRRNAFIKGLI